MALRSARFHAKSTYADCRPHRTAWPPCRLLQVRCQAGGNNAVAVTREMLGKPHMLQQLWVLWAQGGWVISCCGFHIPISCCSFHHGSKNLPSTAASLIVCPHLTRARQLTCRYSGFASAAAFSMLVGAVHW